METGYFISSCLTAFLVVAVLVLLLGFVFFRDEIHAIITCRKNGWRPKSVIRTNGRTEWYGVDRSGRWHKIDIHHENN